MKARVLTDHVGKNVGQAFRLTDRLCQARKPDMRESLPCQSH